MLETLFPSFSNELFKLAAKTLRPAQRADAFHQQEVKDWPKFEGDLKSRAFQKAMLGHEQTDAKLKKYVKNYGASLVSKSVIAVAPSRTEKGKEYKIKVLPTGRLACQCKDWQYYHSVRNSDCDHIKAVRAIYKAGLLKKEASIAKGIIQGVRAQHRLAIAQKSYQQGQQAKQNYNQILMSQLR